MDGRRPSSSGGGAGRAAAAREAMARMEEMMLAHAGAAGEFSIILDAPLPSLQQYRRNPTPPSELSSSSAYRRGAQGRDAGRRREEEVPARLRREGSLPDAVGDADAARASHRRGPSAGSTRPRAGGVRGDAEEAVEAPVRLADPRGARRPPNRGQTPPPTRVTEVRRVVADQEEEETPLQLLSRGGRSSSATRPAEAPREVEVGPAAATRPSSQRSRPDAGVKATAVNLVESVGRRSSRGSEDRREDAAALPRPLAAVVTSDRSRSNSPVISNVKVDIFAMPFPTHEF
jgi:hypothetical protein